MTVGAMLRSFVSALPEERSPRRSFFRTKPLRRVRSLSRKALLITLSAAGAFSALTGHVASAAEHPHREHKRDYKREIEAVEEEWRTAQLNSDFATMDKLLAEDYFGISVTGQLNNKMQQLERLKKRTLVITKIDVSDRKIKLVGRVAIVTSLAEFEGTNEGEALKGKFRYTRVYKRYPDGSWKITNFEVTRVPGTG
jgi:ketosteroid isomerase-like protein